MIQKNPFIGNTVKLSGSADVSALKENGSGIVLDIISPEQVEVGHLVIRQKNYSNSGEYIALEAYSGDWNEIAWKIDRDPKEWKELTTITGEYDTQHTYSISKTQYSEILVEYGSKNGTQVFFGGSVNLVTSEDRPSAPCWTYSGQVYTAYVHYSKSTEILTVKNMDYSNDMLFRIYAR